MPRSGDPLLNAKPMRLHYLEDNYGVGWGGFTPPDGKDGQIIVVRNHDGGGNTRIYIYADSTWGYVNLSGD